MSVHISANPGDIAETVILPGDPLRAKYMAEKYLTDYARVNETRNMWGYTGYYKGKRISIMSTGMGITSMMIYVTELCRDYGCKNLIRIGTCGAYREDIRLGDILVAQAVSTTSSLHDHTLPGHLSPCADFELLKKVEQLAVQAGLTVRVGNMVTEQVLYLDDELANAKKWSAYGVLGAECEGEGLYSVSAQYGAKAVMMAEVVANCYHPDAVQPPEYREHGMDGMLKVSLDLASSIA